jgi:hypothetical protein
MIKKITNFEDKYRDHLCIEECDDVPSKELQLYIALSSLNKVVNSLEGTSSLPHPTDFISSKWIFNTQYKDYKILSFD